jgi:hypothetical protein
MLGFEQLSSRQLLAGDVESATDETGPADSAAALVAPAPVVAAVAPASPLWDDGGGATTQNSENGYGQYYPPAIMNFGGSEHMGVWTFTGQVIDDKPVAGCMVRFGGLMEGQYTLVRADGTFEISAYFPPNTSGVVTAIVTDTDSLDSDPVEYSVW